MALEKIKIKIEGTNTNNNSGLAIIENERTEAPEVEETSSQNRPTVDVMDITYAQLFQVAPNIRKKIARITRAGRIVTTKMVKYCLKADKEEKTISMYCKAQVRGYPILLVLDSGSSKCIVLENFLKEVSISIDCSSTVVMIGVHEKQKWPLGEVDEFSVTVGAKTILSRAVITDAGNYTIIDSEYKTIYLNEEKEKEDFKLGLLMSMQEIQLRDLLATYKNIFQEESGQLGKTSIAQHEIYIEEGPPIKQNFTLPRNPHTSS
ncbi:43660_t:CDS:2 [Gigaspora margarita]|uniref:43660_t:CDS:1 n=1 Tax=Gigaspora margarita TaxID=4874 RepID=A0ABN7UPH2_GIGMA|nr:43660_t:CDS:2 [Gigaspora margarita]